MMRAQWAVIALLVVVAEIATFPDAAVRSSIRFRVSSRYRSSYRSSYRYTYVPSGPLYSRRMSVSLMGPLYYGYASRYPLYFNYRADRFLTGGDLCKNNLAIANGSYVGNFSCPFLPDEPADWIKCCGYENEGFCCDPDYDDSWKNPALTAVAIVFIVLGCLFAVGTFIGLLVYCCCCCCIAAQSSTEAAEASSQPFVEPSGGKQVEGSTIVPPPYPPMEYGSISVQPQGQAQTAPYPQQPPPYPPPYSAGQN